MFLALRVKLPNLYTYYLHQHLLSGPTLSENADQITLHSASGNIVCFVKGRSPSHREQFFHPPSRKYAISKMTSLSLPLCLSDTSSSGLVYRKTLVIYLVNSQIHFNQPSLIKRINNKPDSSTISSQGKHNARLLTEESYAFVKAAWINHEGLFVLTNGMQDHGTKGMLEQILWLKKEKLPANIKKILIPCPEFPPHPSLIILTTKGELYLCKEGGPLEQLKTTVFFY